MGEDKLPKVGAGDPDGEPTAGDADLLGRAAREIRASAALQAFVPLSPAERERLADAAIECALDRALGASGPGVS
ncbi:MAG TPA: hypothetical protein VF469_36770, partial [Kofleriaceae bacterium]